MTLRPRIAGSAGAVVTPLNRCIRRQGGLGRFVSVDDDVRRRILCAATSTNDDQHARDVSESSSASDALSGVARVADGGARRLQ